MKKSILSKILSDSHQRIAILCHLDPDPDTLGAAFALEKVLLDRGKAVDVVCRDKISKSLLPLTKNRSIKNNLDQQYDILVAVDIGGLEKTGFAEKIKSFKGEIYLIDHHYPSEEFATEICRSVEVSSTCELLFELFEHCEIHLDQQMATWLLAGIVFDTQYFQHASSSARVLEIAAELLRQGARMPKLIKQITGEKPLKVLKLWGNILNRLKINRETNAAWAVVTDADFEQTNTTSRDLSGLISIVNSVEKSDFCLILSQTGDNLIKGSLRSDEFKSKHVDVSRIANRFGGGGHKYASGFMMPGKLVQDEEKWKIINN